ncbi:MAG: nucleotide exchange factor GrpE [Rhodospirillales bacterium]|jgi:molecular chaperone GrpE|nr:nucleotide exchange factor GrpE [Rhodospirillales bacterium]MBT4005592.1 nucleotide exchange factor GrpE [Rhodospirillales bacterium]MBT5076068.1 nucleotide exchange factor GrpE [Rhodospirillales bacterium]MBT5112311.1 nucleotide exchange factor GrpE [Rhodospirillales bacterium]MBT5672012.1 nucleotide exchange factor GrpE [Rhodospirillales bacterium]
MSEKTETPANDSGEPDQESPDVAVNPKDATDGSGSQPEEAPDPEAEIASLQDKLLRSMAEFENFRRRSDREREDTAKYAIANFARDCLTTVDNLRRGLDSIDMDARKENAALETLAQGMELTERELLGVLERNGVAKIEAMGALFDHDLHQAMFEIDDPERAAGIVAQVTQEGYVLNGRLLRPAMVGVTKGGPKPVVSPIANEEAIIDTDAK